MSTSLKGDECYTFVKPVCCALQGCSSSDLFCDIRPSLCEVCRRLTTVVRKWCQRTGQNLKDSSAQLQPCPVAPLLATLFAANMDSPIFADVSMRLGEQTKRLETLSSAESRTHSLAIQYSQPLPDQDDEEFTRYISGQLLHRYLK